MNMVITTNDKYFKQNLNNIADLTHQLKPNCLIHIKTARQLHCAHILTYMPNCHGLSCYDNHTTITTHLSLDDIEAISLLTL